MKYKFINEYEVQPYKNGFIILDNKIYTNPKEETLARAGYKELVTEDEPEYNPETQYVVPVYTETDTEIVQSWEIKETEMIADENTENSVEVE